MRHISNLAAKKKKKKKLFPLVCSRLLLEKRKWSRHWLAGKILCVACRAFNHKY